MRSANWDSLREKIIRPGIEKYLVPLMLYRGTQGFGWMHRRWNFAIQCMESEVTTFTEAIRISRNPDFAHLCHSVKKIDHNHLGSVFGRLLDNPKITDNVQGLTQYVRDIEGIKYQLTRVSLYADSHQHPQRVSPWRIPINVPKKPRGRPLKVGNGIFLPTAETIEFPFMLHRPGSDWEKSLLKDVHAIVPKTFPAWLRADVCQDLVTDILAGQLEVGELDGSIRAIVAKVFNAHPIKYAGLAL